MKWNEPEIVPSGGDGMDPIINPWKRPRIIRRKRDSQKMLERISTFFVIYLHMAQKK